MQTLTHLERTPEGYRIERIAVDLTSDVPLTPSTDALAAKTTQELEALAADLDTQTVAQQAYWQRFRRMEG